MKSVTVRELIKNIHLKQFMEEYLDRQSLQVKFQNRD